MSCLLLKTTSGNFQKEVVKATHDGIVGEISYEQFFEGGSCWSTSDPPLCTLQGDSREGGSWEESLSSVDRQPGIWSSRNEELQTCISTSKNDCHKHWKDLECANAIHKPECHQEQLAWEEYIVDELVCKLISHLHIPSESPTFCTEKAEVQELDNQEGDPQGGKVSASSLDAGIFQSSLQPCVEDNKDPLPLGLPEHANSNGGCHHDPVKLRSALRGGYEKTGLGHRPRMHVTWAPDVYDPPCTSTSHTSNHSRRKHHHPKGDHKNRNRGKGSSHTDSQKKAQKKLFRRLKHTGEFFSSASTVFAQRGQHNSPSRLQDYIASSLDDLTLKGSRVGPFTSLPKACFLSPMFTIGDCELVTLGNVQGCGSRSLPTPKLLV
ncbi:hypothetical protein L7F22_048042 [Adiantum nelumboides]|nr:hypothetical protein [Adiantum nelumboides]